MNKWIFCAKTSVNNRYAGLHIPWGRGCAYHIQLYLWAKLSSDQTCSVDDILFHAAVHELCLFFDSQLCSTAQLDTQIYKYIYIFSQVQSCRIFVGLDCNVDRHEMILQLSNFCKWGIKYICDNGTAYCSWYICTIGYILRCFTLKEINWYVDTYFIEMCP